MRVPQLHLGAGSTLGPLSIFPVWSASEGNLGISTGTHADVAVAELAGGAQVSRLSVANRRTRPALLLEGELLEGGQQHRTCVRDVVLGPGEVREIDTYCVEAGRWSGSSEHRRQARRAPLNVRAELASDGGLPAGRSGNRQGRIWERVRRFDAARGASATSSLVEHLDAGPRDPRFRVADAPAVLDGQRGVLLGLGTKPLLLELFGTHTLFRRHYRQLLASALLDLELLPPQVLTSGTMPAQRARDFAALVQQLAVPEALTASGPGSSDPAAAEVRDHGTLRSSAFTRSARPIAAAGIAVELPQREPQLAHLTSWNTHHPLMELSWN